MYIWVTVTQITTTTCALKMLMRTEKEQAKNPMSRSSFIFSNLLYQVRTHCTERCMYGIINGYLFWQKFSFFNNY